MKFKELLDLFFLRFVVFCRNTIEAIKVACRYYRYSTFFKVDLAMRWAYLFRNPFSISKKFLMQQGEEDVYAYGETPLTTLETIAIESGITPLDCVYELGCGRGLGCFWLSIVVGCKVVGIEYIPEFIQKANRIKKQLHLTKVEFLLSDMYLLDFKGATVCYLYGTCLDEPSIQKLIKKFAVLPIGTKIITVSYPLSDYTDPEQKKCFKLLKQFSVPFTWGRGEIFVQVVV